MSKKGENIRKRKDGRWEARFIDFYGENGKAHHKSVYARSYTEVKQKVRMFISNKTSIKSRTDKKYVEKVAQEWLDKAKLRIKQSSFCRYYTIVHKHILPYFKALDISAVTRESVEKFIDYKLQTLAIKTVCDVTAVLTQIIRFAERSGYITGFSYDIDLPKLPTKELDILSYTDEQKLNAYLKNNMTPENFGVMLTKATGLRIGELCALKWSDFDLDNGTVNINKTLQRIKNLDTDTTATSKTAIVITAPKSQKSVRKIPLPNSIMPIIRELYNYNEPNTYILTGTKKYTEPRIVQRMFTNLLKISGIIYVNFHSLRHLFATRAVESGFDIKSLSEILGHSTVKTTLERYVHSSFELKRECMNRMAGCF